MNKFDLFRVLIRRK